MSGSQQATKLAHQTRCPDTPPRASHRIVSPKERKGQRQGLTFTEHLLCARSLTYILSNPYNLEGRCSCPCLANQITEVQRGKTTSPGHKGAR